MAEIRPPERQKTDAPLIPGFIKGAAIAGAMTWILALLAVLTTKSPSGSGLEALFPIFVVVAATLFLLIFVLPAAIIYWLCRRLIRLIFM